MSYDFRINFSGRFLAAHHETSNRTSKKCLCCSVRSSRISLFFWVVYASSAVLLFQCEFQFATWFIFVFSDYVQSAVSALELIELRRLPLKSCIIHFFLIFLFTFFIFIFNGNTFVLTRELRDVICQLNYHYNIKRLIKKKKTLSVSTEVSIGNGRNKIG